MNKGLLLDQNLCENKNKFLIKIIFIWHVTDLEMLDVYSQETQN